MELKKGQIVISRKGRDVQRPYVIVGWAADRLLLVNGKKWTLRCPKSKNIRHIQPTMKVLPPDAYSTDDNTMAALAAYEVHCGPNKEG